MVAIVCLVLFSAGGQLFSDVRTTALTYGTFGAYIIVPIFLILGFVIGEVTPVLLVGGTMLFSTQAYRNLFQIKPGSLAGAVDWIFRRGIILFLRHYHVQIGSGAQPASYAIGTAGFFP